MSNDISGREIHAGDWVVVAAITVDGSAQLVYARVLDAQTIRSPETCVLVIDEGRVPPNERDRIRRNWLLEARHTPCNSPNNRLPPG